MAVSEMPPADFDKQGYWHARFAAESSFEWLLPSPAFMALLGPLLDRLDRPAARILHLGPGTSELHTLLRARGFVGVTNVDYEPLAIDRARQLERRAFGDVSMRYAVADATRLADADDGRPLGRFDLVVDKGAVDAVACAGDDALLRMARSVRDRLAHGAVWISLSYSATRFHLDGLPFDVEVLAKVPTPKRRATDPDIYYWCYLMRPR